MNEKLLKKLNKILGEDAVNQARSLSVEQLEDLLVAAAKEIEETAEELEENPHFQKAKEDLKYLKQGLNEVRKLNNAKIKMAIMLLSERGQVK